MRVLKFGGTSVGSADAIRSVAQIAAERAAADGGIVVVLSATSGTTNALLDLAQRAILPTTDIPAEVDVIVQRHIDLVDVLFEDADAAMDARSVIREIGADLERLLTGMAVLDECTAQSLDAVAAFGERWSTHLVARLLDAQGVNTTWFDARTVVRTNDRFTSATVDLDTTRTLCDEHLSPLLKTGGVIVTQGFVGATDDGITTTLGRGGSDATAALLGACLDADEVEIWTDVSGVYSADPRDIKGARPVPSLFFGEVRELALYGAKVLHPDAIVPAVKADIPVRVLNTFKPTESGTVITSKARAHGELHAVSVVKNCSLVNGTAEQVRQIVRTGNMLRRVILESISLEHSFVVVTAPTDREETEVEVAIAGLDMQAEKVGVLIITGPKATTAHTIERIGGALRGLPVIAVLNGMSKWSTFVVVGSDHVLNAQRALHGLLR